MLPVTGKGVDVLESQLSELAGAALTKDWVACMCPHLLCLLLQLANATVCVCGRPAVNPRVKYTKQNLGKLLELHLSMAPNKADLLTHIVKVVRAVSDLTLPHTHSNTNTNTNTLLDTHTTNDTHTHIQPVAR